MKRIEKLCLALTLAVLTPHLSQLYAAPNVVVLLSDDLGFKDIGCYDGPVKTPALDGLAANGTRFTDFYSGCAVCSPSRATLLTGRHHIRTGVYSWVSNDTQKTHLLEREITLAEILKKAGYATAHLGKWHLGLPTKTVDKPTPAEHGFDYWFATDNNAEPSHRNPKNFIRNGKAVGPLEGYACQLVVDEAITWLDQHRPEDAPFFLNVWFHEPHKKCAAPDSIVEIYDAANSELQGKKRQREKGPAIYSATIDNTDRAIARLLAKLKEVDDPENTLIIYASDNGSYLPGRAGDLRGLKGENWDGGIRVPGIFCWPGSIMPKQVQSTPAGLVDVVPTICGLLDIAPPEDVYLDGSDLSPLLKGKPTDFSRHQPLFWHLQKSRPIVAMRDGDFSLVAEPDYELSTHNNFDEAWIPAVKSGSYKEFRLYNLKQDPGQRHDLADEQPERLENLKKKLLSINKSIMADGPDWHLQP